MNHEYFMLDDFLKEAIKNNTTFCKECELNHNGICFFAYDCMRGDFVHFTDKDTEED